MFHVKHWDQLEALVDTLVRWQKAINLVGKATLDDVWTRHILDSAQLLPLIPKDAKTLADLGSGARLSGPGPGGPAARARCHPDRVRCPQSAPFWARPARRMGLTKQPKVVDQPDRSRARRPRPMS